MTSACLLLALFMAPAVQEESEAGEKAKKDLAEIRNSIGRLGRFKPKAQELQSKIRAAATPEERQKLTTESQKLSQDFQTLRDETLKAIDTLIASATAAL